MIRFIPGFDLEDKITEEFIESGAQDDVSEEIAEAARAVAPVDTGEDRDSIHVEEGKVVADTDHAAAVEFGTGDTPMFAPLRRGAETVVGSDGMKARD